MRHVAFIENSDKTSVKYENVLLLNNTGISIPLGLDFTLKGNGCIFAKQLVAKCVNCKNVLYDKKINVIFQILNSSTIDCFSVSDLTSMKIEKFMSSDSRRLEIEYFDDFNEQRHPQVSSMGQMCTDDIDDQIYEMCFQNKIDLARLTLVSLFVNADFENGHPGVRCPHCERRSNQCPFCEEHRDDCRCERCENCGYVLEDCECCEGED